jgi:hypothetical protein
VAFAPHKIGKVLERSADAACMAKP